MSMVRLSGNTWVDPHRVVSINAYNRKEIIGVRSDTYIDAHCEVKTIRETFTWYFRSNKDAEDFADKVATIVNEGRAGKR